VLDSVKDDSAGGTVLFVGTIRNTDNGKRVRELEYEAYSRMAARRFRKIEREVRSKWPVRGIKMVHREGRLKVGEVSVVIAVSARHRAEAFEAARYAIDRVKSSVPIWKREMTKDGRRMWVAGRPIES